MKLSEKDVAYFFELETSLHKSNIVNSVEITSALLADAFVEFGSSGRVWNKSSIVESMRGKEQHDQEVSVEDFVARELASDVVLVTYTSRRLTAGPPILRSSIWKRSDGKWQMIFHQGTPTSGLSGQ
jgi:hypothetical protein